jgi:hypothetical protein
MDDPNLPPDDPPPMPTPAPARPRLACEFCECALTPAGDVLRMSDTARAYLKQREQIAELRATMAGLTEHLAAAEAATRAATDELAALRQPTGTPRFWQRTD